MAEGSHEQAWTLFGRKRGPKPMNAHSERGHLHSAIGKLKTKPD